jgi:hypothetical protein
MDTATYLPRHLLETRAAAAKAACDYWRPLVRNVVVVEATSDGIESVRRCNRCRVIKPIDEFRHLSHRPGMRSSSCFGCEATNPDTRERRCYRCRTWKPFAEFHRFSRDRHGITPACKACRCEIDRLRRDRMRRAGEQVAA